MESPFPCSQVLLFDEGKLNSKVPEEDLLPIKEIVKSIREMQIDVVEVLYLIRINIKLQEQNNQKMTDITGKADAHLKELELHKSKTEADPDFRQNFLGQFANAAKMARRGSPY